MKNVSGDTVIGKQVDSDLTHSDCTMTYVWYLSVT